MSAALPRRHADPQGGGGRLRRAVPLALLLLTAPLAGPALALPMGSPWWENYDQTHRFLCPGRGMLVVERNESQASILSGGFRSTLFREEAAGPGLSFRNQDLRLIIEGDTLTLLQAPTQITCMRTEEA